MRVTCQITRVVVVEILALGTRLHTVELTDDYNKTRVRGKYTLYGADRSG